MITRHRDFLKKKELKKQNDIEAGRVSEHFPEVSEGVIRMTYYQKGPNPVMMVRTVNIHPSSAALFNMSCMVTGCQDGGFDLTPIIADMVKKRKKVVKGSLDCHGTINDLSSFHGRIEYETTIHYKSVKG